MQLLTELGIAAFSLQKLVLLVKISELPGAALRQECHVYSQASDKAALRQE